MAHDLVLAPTRVLDADEAHHLGTLLASSGYFSDAREAAQAAVKVMAGAELGLGPVASMRGVDIIKGEVSLGAGLVAAIVRRSGEYDYDIERWEDDGCTLVFTRHGKALNPPITFDHAAAVRAGLANGDNYRKYPKAMYFARAMTMGARAHCPELFAGSIYTSSELGVEEHEDAASPAPPATDATVPGSAEPPQPASAPTLDDAIARGEVEGLETPAEPTPPEPDRTIAQAAAVAAEHREGEPASPSELARQQGISDATQRFILITFAGIEDASDLDAAYQSLNEDQLKAVVGEWKKRAS